MLINIIVSFMAMNILIFSLSDILNVLFLMSSY